MLVLFTCLLSAALGYPIDDESPRYTILYDGPDGRHVQSGEPGRRVTGYFTSRSLDGSTEYRTDYVADENGYRPVGEHLPHSRPAAALRSHDAAPYVINYDLNGQSHYQLGEPGKAVEGSFMFSDAAGRSHRVNYVADEKGYRIKSVDDVSAAPGTLEPSAFVPETMAQDVPVALEPEQSTATSEEPAAVEQPDVTYSTYVRDSEEVPDVPAARPDDDGTGVADESDDKPVGEPSVQSSDALELADSDADLKAEPKGEQIAQVDEDLKEEPVNGEESKSNTEAAEPSSETGKAAYVEVSSSVQAANDEKKEVEGQADLRSLYEQYAAQRSKFDGPLKDEKHLLFNYPFYANYAPSFYAQERRYPFAYSSYQYPGYLIKWRSRRISSSFTISEDFKVNRIKKSKCEIEMRLFLMS